MGKDVNKTCCGDHFTIYMNIESLSCTPETTIMLHVNYTSTTKQKRKKIVLNVSEDVVELIHSF